jgi:hypothetical protein
MIVSSLKLWTPPANGGIVPPWLRVTGVAADGTMDVRVPTPDDRVIRILPMPVPGGRRDV